MEFFNQAITVLQTLVIALGAGLGVWGVINLLEGYGKAAEVQMEGTITFYVAECMEFPVMGEFHDGLSLDEAIKVYESIPSDRMHGISRNGRLMLQRQKQRNVRKKSNIKKKWEVSNKTLRE